MDKTSMSNSELDNALQSIQDPPSIPISMFQDEWEDGIMMDVSSVHKTPVAHGVVRPQRLQAYINLESGLPRPFGMFPPFKPLATQM
jgi:hypothetical protein